MRATSGKGERPVEQSVLHELDILFRLLLDTYGPRSWWPAETPFEVCVGAILTQNTNWGNVEKAIANLKRIEALTPERLRLLPEDELAADKRFFQGSIVASDIAAQKRFATVSHFGKSLSV